MIDKENPTDSLGMDQKTSTGEEPPPYTRRQASTSSGTRGVTSRLRSLHSPTNSGSRISAPVSAPAMPSPQLVISPAESDYYISGPSAPKKDPQAPSFVDHATEKPVSPKNGPMYPDYGYTSQTSMRTYSGEGSGMASTSTAGGIAQRSPATVTRKGTDTLIMMGTGTSGMWLNHVVVVNKGELIQGAYHIDPNLDVPDHATQRRTLHLSKKAHSRSNSASPSKSGKKKEDHSWHPTTAPELCNAIFETKTGSVEILLSIGGLGASRASKANIDVKAKQGRAVVRVMEIVEGRRLNLDVATGKGDIEVYLPRNFSGPLHVHTEGEITLLPRLAAVMEVISAREDDALVMITPAKVPSSPTPTSSSRSYHEPPHRAIPGGLSQWLHPSTSTLAQTYQGDFVNLVSSGGGGVKVGFVDDDNVKEESPGMWAKFVRLLSGRSNSA